MRRPRRGPGPPGGHVGGPGRGQRGRGPRPAGEATGLVPELLTGVDEGRALSLAGAVADLDPAEGPFLVLDIGGGSTQLRSSVPGPTIPIWSPPCPLQLGCVRMSERFFAGDPPSADELAAAAAEVDAQLGATVPPPIRSTWRPAGWWELAGTVSTVAVAAPGTRRLRPGPDPPPPSWGRRT